MVEMAVVLVALVAAIVFVMRMDEDPTRWARRRRPHRRRDGSPVNRASDTAVVDGKRD